MTQEELRTKLDESMGDDSLVYLDSVMELINQHVAEVIGDNDTVILEGAGRIPDMKLPESISRNDLRAEQRKRAEL